MQQFSLFDDHKTEDLAARAYLVHQRLKEHYKLSERDPEAEALDPLSQLVFSFLSQRTRGPEARAAFACLRDRYPDWHAVMMAPTPDIEAAIASCTWPEQKAPRLQTVLRTIHKQSGRLSLDFLQKVSTKAAHDWLKKLPAVGPKTGASVLAFSTLNRRILPVDSHHYRIAQRLAIIPSTLRVGPAHKVLEDQLPAAWDASAVCAHHDLMKLHGQLTCTHNNPACPRCPVHDVCPFGQHAVTQA
jgi:endonuclease-3